MLRTTLDPRSGAAGGDGRDQAGWFEPVKVVVQQGDRHVQGVRQLGRRVWLLEAEPSHVEPDPAPADRLIAVAGATSVTPT